MSTPLLDNTIEPDEVIEAPPAPRATNNTAAPQVVLTPGARPATQMASSAGDAEAAHPVALFFLFFFRTAAIAVYLLCGFFTENYVLSTVVVVVLLSMDFWNCQRIRTDISRLVQVDDDGESYWVFESRDNVLGKPSLIILPTAPVSTTVFASTTNTHQIALYTYPCLWLALFIVSLLKLRASFIPIVLLALVFNVSNAVGFTYADRDAKTKWANQLGSGWGIPGIGGIGGSILSGVVKNSVGRVFR
ncbi:hypothetical protein EIP86_002944 [Pleurotus ostreatoroseus]|nr:hypothetical protein EIP86_002944 [Pleurotus ostreatoroseus]